MFFAQRESEINSQQNAVNYLSIILTALQ